MRTTHANRSLTVSVVLGGIAAACNIACSISIKENPQSIWPSIAWSGLFAIPFIFYRSRRTYEDGQKTKSISNIWAQFIVEVTAGCVHVVCVYFVLLFLELGDSIVLGNGIQVFGLILAEYFILSKRPSKISVICSLVILIGILMVAQPPFLFKFFQNSSQDRSASDTAIGMLLCTLMALNGVIFYTYISKFSHISSSTHASCQGLLIFITASIITMVHMQRSEWGDLACYEQRRLIPVFNGFVQFLGQFAAIISSKTSSPFFALIIRLIVIPGGYAVQLLYFGKAYDISSLVGALIIVVAISIQSVVQFRKKS